MNSELSEKLSARQLGSARTTVHSMETAIREQDYMVSPQLSLLDLANQQTLPLESDVSDERKGRSDPPWGGISSSSTSQLGSFCSAWETPV